MSKTDRKADDVPRTIRIELAPVFSLIPDGASIKIPVCPDGGKQVHPRQP